MSMHKPLGRHIVQLLGFLAVSAAALLSLQHLYTQAGFDRAAQQANVMSAPGSAENLSPITYAVRYVSPDGRIQIPVRPLLASRDGAAPVKNAPCHTANPGVATYAVRYVSSDGRICSLFDRCRRLAITRRASIRPVMQAPVEQMTKEPGQPLDRAPLLRSGSGFRQLN